MPLPLVMLGWVALALAAGTLSVAAAHGIRTWLKTNHTIALIGRPGAGKSALLHVIEHGEVPDSAHMPTTGQQTTEVRIDNLTAHVIDSAGDRLAQWQSAMQASQGIVYCFDASLVARQDPQALSALQADADHIAHLRAETAGEKRFTLVGTHTDLFLDGSDVEQVRKNSVVQSLKLACSVGNDDLLLGSLNDKRSAMRLVSDLAKHQSKVTV